MAKRIAWTESNLWIFLVAALLPLVLFALVMLAVFNNQQRNALEALMREASISASNAVDNEVGATVAVLSALEATVAFQSEDWPAFAKMLKPVVADAGWLSLAVTDRDSQLFNLSGIGPVIDQVGMEEALATGRPAVSDLIPLVRIILNRPLLFAFRSFVRGGSRARLPPLCLPRLSTRF